MRAHLPPRTWTAPAVVIACMLASLARAEERMIALEAPAGATGRFPHLAGGDTGLWLSWMEDGAGGPELRCARWDGKAWATPRTVVAGPMLWVNWADVPSVVPLAGGSLAAHWLQTSGPGTYDYDVKVSLSRDQGATWTAPVSPHRDGVKAEHGFVSLVDLGAGRFAACWLDGRRLAGAGGEGAGEMELRFAAWEGDAFGPETVLDPRTCECCPTAMVSTSRGLLAVFRDRSADEVRDVQVVRQQDTKWSVPVALHGDGWKIAGCPVNGPAADAEGERVAVAWPTSAHGAPEVWAAFSGDGGASFGSPVRVDGGRPLGRVDVALRADGSAVVVWLEAAGANGAEVRARGVSPEGPQGEALCLGRTHSGRPSGIPRVARWNGGLYAAWTETDGRSCSLRLARMRE